MKTLWSDGKLDAKPDWGHAKDYVEMQWLMLQQDQPEDFVIATGQQYSVRDFVNAAAAELGMEIRWEGQGVEEKGYWANAPATPVGASLARERAAGAGEVGVVPDADSRAGTLPQGGILPQGGTLPSGHAPTKSIIAVDPRYFRPTEVETLLGDATKAREKLGWMPQISFDELVAEMVREDLNSAERDELVRNSGYAVMNHHE
jgi:GDPmannose 4,6-dehydratase